MLSAGYWDAVHPSGPIASAYPLHCLTLKSDVLPSADTTFYLPDSSSLAAYYTAYFTFLRSAGVTYVLPQSFFHPVLFGADGAFFRYVKVDDQAHLDFIVSSSSSPNLDLGLLRRTMLSAMQTAARDIFGSDRVVHCMAGSPRIFGGPLALTSGTSSIVRNSDGTHFSFAASSPRPR